MIHGILPVWKHAGLTSHDVVAILRKLLRQKKIGHSGTLDPQAEGVLPVCLGQATRVAEYLLELPKTYQAEMTLGIATDTQDQAGRVVDTSPVEGLDFTQVEHVFHSFVGTIEQVPPMVSAVKIKGKKLYQLARQGIVVERPARKVHIYDLKITAHRLSSQHPTISFEVTCSRGTYIRTLCVDIGRALGYPAHLSHLVRIKSGPYPREACFTLPEIERAVQQQRVAAMILPVDSAVGHLPEIQVGQKEVSRVLNGQPLDYRGRGLVRVYAESGQFLAIYDLDENLAQPVKVFKDLRDEEWK
jgi:tRNA pseudouridine55 synthase